MIILPAFSVIPKKTFLGLDKNSSYCFTVKKSLTSPFIDFFKLTRDKLQQEINLVTKDGEFPALIRLIIQDKSKPNKIGIERTWKKRFVLNVSWKDKSDTIAMMNANFVVAINLVGRGLKNNRQDISFEHLGDNRFYISFNSIYL